jgi:hypothetical protein
MMFRYTRSYLFLIAVLIKAPCQCMEVIEHSVNGNFSRIPLDVWKEVEPYLPTNTLRSLACIREMSEEFDTPYWTKIFNLREARRTTPGTILYNRTNEKLRDLALASNAHSYNHELYETLLKDPYFDTNYSDSSGRTVLMHASKQFCIPLIKSLVNNRANLNLYTGPNKKSPLSYAILAPFFYEKLTPELLDNQNKTIECLTQLGANINHSTDQGNYLFFALDLNVLSVIPTLLACGINPNHKRIDGMRPLGFMVKTFPRMRPRGFIFPRMRTSNIPSQEIVDSTVVALMKGDANPYKPLRHDKEATILQICNWQNRELALVMQNNLKGGKDWYDANTPKS